MGLSIAESGVLLMMTTLQGYVRQGRRSLSKWLLNSRVQLYGRAALYVLAGFGFSAAGLFHHCMPIAMAFVCGCSGTSAVLAAVGSTLGYLAFWGSAGHQGVLWAVCALGISLALGTIRQQTPLLLPALAALIVSASGVVFQVWFQQEAPLEVYLLRVGLAGGCSWLFHRVLRRRDPILDWLTGALGVLALAQMMPIPYFNFGVMAAGMLAVTGAFPAAALAGVALDLAGITPVSMTATLCTGYLVRFIPGYPKWLMALMGGCAYILVMNLGGNLDLYPLPALLAGGILGLWLPLRSKTPARRGETGVAQVRLEMVAGALFQTEQLLLECPQVPVDADAILERAAETACAGCAVRSGCKDSGRIAKLPGLLLQKPLLTAQELPIVCRKSGRFLAQLHRAQEQLRSIQADRQRQEEYRAAVMQQYRFLGEYLQQLSDQLARKADTVKTCFEASVEVFGNRQEQENGDRWAVFAGIRDLHYAVLCDGMGTGMGAVQEGRTALLLLRRLLTAGYPAEAALQSLNSLCALRSRAGAVTVDLLEIELSTGKVRLFKWGAAPSYLISSLGAEKIGTASPPPGLSVTEQRETVYRLSLSRGERLVLVSDGVGEEEALHCCTVLRCATPGELAQQLLRQSLLGGEDDATVAVVTLKSVELG